MKHLSTLIAAIAFIFYMPLCARATTAPITGTTAICAGLTTNLTDATTGGTWSSSTSTVAVVSSATGMVTGLSAGTTTISYTASGSTVTTVVTVNPNPMPITGSLSICSGWTTSLSDGMVGGTWSSSNTLTATVGSSTGLVTGIGAGTIVVSYVLSTGCFATATVSVNPNPGPISGLGSTVCVGASVSVSDTVAGGTWSSSNTAVAMVGSSGMLTGNSIGTSNITYSMGGGCFATAVVTVNNAGGSISGPGAVCTGSSITLSSAISGGTWFSGSTAATLGSSTGVVTGVSSGSALISYVLSTGCTTTHLVTVIPTPGAILSSGSTLCVGRSTLFSDAVAGGTWASTDTAVATIAFYTGVAMGNSAGTAVISYDMGGGCTASMVVTVNGIPAISGAASVCTGSNITLTTTIAGGAWSSGAPGTASVGSGSGIVTGVTSGQAVITYTIAGCAGIDTMTIGNSFGSVINDVSTTCTAPDFYVSACGISSAYNVTIHYGDGTSDNTALSSTGICHADVLHTYAAPGTYTVKEVLYNGTTPVDSGTFTYNYSFCRYLPVEYYYDANTNCIMDVGETLNTIPFEVQVDSNGIVIDTLPATSGIYYKALGSPGTVYGFKVISTSMSASCAADSVVYDTILATVTDYAVKYCGLYCIGVSGFDLGISASLLTGRHMATGSLLVSNSYCSPSSAVITANFGSDYIYGWAIPAPTSVVGSTITWDLTSLSLGSGTHLFQFRVNVPGAWLIPGDTIQSNYNVTPVAGDLNPANNYCVILDTVNGSYDPNEMSVSPAAYIAPGTKLQYTINFENTGNDTAFNISVYDTLPDNVAVSSLRIVAASAVMNTTLMKDGVHNIVKFDFPGINLLDSTHHNQCDGMVVFSINALNGLPQCTTISNKAGIYFDYNAVVMTNSVTNIIGAAPVAGPITGVDTICVGLFSQLSDASAGGTWSVSNGNASVAAGDVSGNVPGLDTVVYTVTNACGSTASSTHAVYVEPTSYCVNGVHNVGVNSTIVVFPNPATTTLTIQSGLEPITDVSITNLLGQEIYGRQFAVGSLQVDVDVSTLPPGIYFVKVNNTEVRKFVKE